MSSEEQARAYLREAQLTLQSAHAIYESALQTESALWATVVKNGYDAIEQAVSAAIASTHQSIPRNHPGKINKFLEVYNVPDEVEEILLAWLRRRSNSHYVDIRGNELNIPHQSFEKKDAQQILGDAEVIIALVQNIIREE